MIELKKKAAPASAPPFPPKRGVKHVGGARWLVSPPLWGGRGGLTRARPLLLFLVGTLLAACRTDKSEIIQKQVAARVAKFRAERVAEHEGRLLDEASRMVDSLLLDEARRNLQDSLGNVRPIKPGKPEPIAPLDSARVGRLF